jgi:hemoglobin
MKGLIIALMLLAGPDDSLYRAFGGHDGVVRLVDDLYVNIDADDRIKEFFEPAKQAHTKAMLVEQLCQVMGGGCVYSGRDMEALHRQMGITKADFDAMVEDLQKAMDKNHVPFPAQSRLLAVLAPMSRAIIYHPKPEDYVTRGAVEK